MMQRVCKWKFPCFESGRRRQDVPVSDSTD
jgi:hypothetical protein